MVSFSANVRPASLRLLKLASISDLLAGLNLAPFPSGVMDKPIRCKLRDAFESSRFFEEMGRARNDRQFSLAMHLGQRALVEVDHDIVLASHDKQGRRLHARECFARQVWSAAARNDCPRIVRQFRRGHERRATAGARAEITDAQLMCGGLLHCPARGVNQAFGEKTDIEAMLRGAN